MSQPDHAERCDSVTSGSAYQSVAWRASSQNLRLIEQLDVLTLSSLPFADRPSATNIRADAFPCKPECLACFPANVLKAESRESHRTAFSGIESSKALSRSLHVMAAHPGKDVANRLIMISHRTQPSF